MLLLRWNQVELAYLSRVCTIYICEVLAKQGESRGTCWNHKARTIVELVELVELVKLVELGGTSETSGTREVIKQEQKWNWWIHHTPRKLRLPNMGQSPQNLWLVGPPVNLFQKGVGGGAGGPLVYHYFLR